LNIGQKGKNSAFAHTFVFHIANMTAKPHQFKVPETAKLGMCDFLQA
jgi:hypothetical protein